MKQQVELHRGSTFEDSDLQAISDLLIEKMLPRRNNIIFFRTGTNLEINHDIEFRHGRNGSDNK